MMKKCLNCGHECEGDFCPECGQNTSTARFQLREMAANVFSSVIGGDYKLLVTCRGLLSRPGTMVRDYLLGKRVRYMAPVALLVTLVAVYAMVGYIVSNVVSPFDTLRLKLQQESVSAQSAQKFIAYYQAFMSNQVYFSLFSVVLNVLPYRYMFRNCRIERPDGSWAALNLAEHFCALVYQSCFNMLLAFAMMPLSAVEGSEAWSTRICLVVPSIYCIVMYRQMCGISWGRSVVLNVMSIVLSLVMSMVALLTIFGLLYGMDNIKQ